MQLGAGWFVRTGSTWRIVWFTLIAAGVWARPTSALWTFFWARPTAAPWTFFWTPTITGGVLTRWVTTVIFTAWAGASARFPPPVENIPKHFQQDLRISCLNKYILVCNRDQNGIKQSTDLLRADEGIKLMINRSRWGVHVAFIFLKNYYKSHNWKLWKVKIKSIKKKQPWSLVTTVCCLTV